MALAFDDFLWPPPTRFNPGKDLVPLWNHFSWQRKCFCLFLEKIISKQRRNLAFKALVPCFSHLLHDYSHPWHCRWGKTKNRLWLFAWFPLARANLLWFPLWARPVSQCSAGPRRKLYCDPWIWKWDSKAEFDRLSSGSWRGHTHHDELDAPYRDMCCDIMLLVPQQHFPAMPQDVSLLCGSALFLWTNFQSILIRLWPGIQFVPAILCGGLWAELI